MSTALGIAATVAVLQQLLEKGLQDLKVADALGGIAPDVTCVAPDQVEVKADASRLNLFVYHQARNPGWFNRDLPSRDDRGQRTASPSLALDLHLLVTAYGMRPYDAEVLLGAAMQVLHETPGLGRAAIRDALVPSSSKPTLPPQLASAGLADQLEQIRITPLNQSLDELVRLWSAFQLPLRPSAAYQLGVVLIDAQHSVRTPLPVTSRGLYVLPMKQPRLDRIEQADGGNDAIRPGSRLTIRGANLVARGMRLQIDGIDVTSTITGQTDNQVDFQLNVPAPPDPMAALRAGVVTVQVLHPIAMGAPPVDHGAVESNVVVFVFNPSATFVITPGATSVLVDGEQRDSGALDVECSPRVDARQRVQLLLNEKAPPAGRPARAYTFDAPDGNGIVGASTDTGSVRIPYRSVVAGSYLARLKVDAGISPLAFVDGRMATPEVVL